MSPLPERRKTPEELAKLRESLGIPDAPPVTGAAPGKTESSPAGGVGEPEAVEKAPPPEPRETVPAGEEAGGAADVPASSGASPGGIEPVVHTLRKSASLPVDQPKPVRHREDGSLPVRRHTDEELMRLRRMDAGVGTAAAEMVAREKLSPQFVILLYLFASTGLALLMIESLWLSKVPAIDLPFDWLRLAVGHEAYRGVVIGLFGGVNLLVLLAAGWVAWRRPLSRHHAGFLTIIAVLVLVFGTLYFFPDLHAS